MITNEQEINLCMNGYDGSIDDFLNAQEQIGFTSDIENIMEINSTSFPNNSSSLDCNYNNLDEKLDYLRLICG